MTICIVCTKWVVEELPLLKLGLWLSCIHLKIRQFYFDETEHIFLQYMMQSDRNSFCLGVVSWIAWTWHPGMKTAFQTKSVKKYTYLNIYYDDKFCFNLNYIRKCILNIDTTRTQFYEFIVEEWCFTLDKHFFNNFLENFKNHNKNSKFICLSYNLSKMLSSSLNALLTLYRTTSAQKLILSDCRIM